MKTIYVALFSLLACPAFGQQLPLFTQYREFSGIINPAAVPNDYLWYEKNLSFGASYRRQWITDQDGPSTQVIRGDYMFEREGTSLLTGGYIINDQAGRVGMTGLYGRFAGVIAGDNPLEQGISLGLNVGVVRYGLDLSNARLANPDDIAVYDIHHKIFTDVGAGVFAYTTLNNGNLLYGGISMPQALGLNVQFRDENRELSIQRQRHYYATAGYKMSLRDEYSFLELSTWVKFIPPLTPHLDVNLRYQMSEHFTIGAGLSTAGYSHLEAGLLFGEERLFRVSYGFDAPFTKTSTYYGSSHEISLAFALEK